MIWHHKDVLARYKRERFTNFLSVPPVGLEPTTCRLRGGCSNQLSYRGIFSRVCWNGDSWEGNAEPLFSLPPIACVMRGFNIVILIFRFNGDPHLAPCTRAYDNHLMMEIMYAYMIQRNHHALKHDYFLLSRIILKWIIWWQSLVSLSTVSPDLLRVVLPRDCLAPSSFLNCYQPLYTMNFCLSSPWCASYVGSHLVATLASPQ